MSELNVPILLTELHGLHRSRCAFRIGVPLPRGCADEHAQLHVVDSTGQPIDHQLRALALWPDRSIKWLQVDGATAVSANESLPVYLRATVSVAQPPSGVVLVLSEDADGFVVNTGVAAFRISKQTIGPFSAVKLGEVDLLAAEGSDVQLVGAEGSQYSPRVDRVFIEESGPLRASIVAEGCFAAGPRTLRFVTRSVFIAGSSAVRFEMKLLNPHVAHHRGGAWDLGDPGSYYLKDLSLRLFPAKQADELRWCPQPEEPARTQAASQSWVLHQDSSGGEHWNSDNHVDRHGQPTVSFRGYRVVSDGKSVEQGERATPCLMVNTQSGWMAASVENFWQNFPKALRWERGVLSVGMFPAESTGEVELQGGEQKRHTVLLEFGAAGQPMSLAHLQAPVIAAVDPASIEGSGAVPYFVATLDESSSAYARYMEQILVGPQSFFAKREIIDEYGWRNFGDLYADHEAVKHAGPRPLVSHYNNQYDFIYGAFQHFERTGDERWLRLMTDAARHMIDIDIYHTAEDKAAFNGGLFWHTDHYKPALTSTHRTYSARNGNGGDYGGGPSNEQNYTSGLLHYYYLTGDVEARQAVLGMAEWVIAMDEGSGTLLSLVDTSPTGLASKTVSPDFHKPGRGAGNSINALLDGYALSRDRRYVRKAEELIHRCIHPADDIAALQLGEPEYRWSYLVFLQVLGKYLECKREWGELDYEFYFARDSLLHYARWVARNEVPYKDVLHKVEIPTETWPAHDIRKSHVLYLAAKYVADEESASLRERAAFFFERCITDVTSFATAHLTRPLVILCVYGGVHAYFRQHAEVGLKYAHHNYWFGEPQVFVGQRQNMKAAIGHKRQVVVSELRRIVRDKLHALKKRGRSG